jgi:hypothetical protein
MIISEKQILQLIQIAHIHLNELERLENINKEFLTACGHHNKKSIANLLGTIADQQSEELKEIE